MEDIKLYSEIEHLIIAWNIDGTKTAGSLTREIMELLNNEGVIQKQQQELLELAYKNYQHKASKEDFLKYGVLRYDEFINKIKTDDEFSEKWGLKIEERELSIDERHQIHTDNVSKLNGRQMYVIYDGLESERVNFYDEENIPTKLITITYNNQIVERYE